MFPFRLAAFQRVKTLYDVSPKFQIGAFLAPTFSKDPCDPGVSDWPGNAGNRQNVAGTWKNLSYDFTSAGPANGFWAHVCQKNRRTSRGSFHHHRHRAGKNGLGRLDRSHGRHRRGAGHQVGRGRRQLRQAQGPGSPGLQCRRRLPGLRPRPAETACTNTANRSRCGPWASRTRRPRPAKHWRPTTRKPSPGASTNGGRPTRCSHLPPR